MSNVPPNTPPPPPGGGEGSAPPPPPPPSQQPSGSPPPPPSGGSPDTERTIMLILSYLGILALIPLLVKKDDRDVQWHAKNGLFLFIAYILAYIVIWGIEYAVSQVMSALGCAFTLLGCALWIAYLVVIVIAIVKAVKGEKLRIPFVSDFADK